MIYAVLLLAVFFLLYLFGFLTVQTKRAVTFVGTGGWGSRCIGASFTACTGKIHRIVRFRESRSYSFQLTGHVQQGSVSVQILDRSGAPALVLNAQNPSGILSAQQGQRYRLYVIFDHASGDYQLDWT